MEEDIKEYLERQLNDYVGTNVFGPELVYTLMEGINADGSVTYNRAQAMEELMADSDYVADKLEEYESMYGEVISARDLLTNPENVQVKLYMMIGDQLLQELPSVGEIDGEVELTEDLAARIIAELKGETI